MPPIIVTLLAALTIVLAMPAAHAQTVYRCGNAYSQAPCPEARLIDVSDARSPAQQAEAQRVADDEGRRAAEMRRERLADERSARGGAAVSLSGYPTTKVGLDVPHRHKKRHAVGKPLPTTDFVAYGPSSRKRRAD